MSLLTVTEVADQVGLSEWAVRRAIRDGELEAFKPRGRIRVKASAVHDWLEATRVEPVRAASGPRPTPAVVTSPSYPGGTTVRPWLRRKETV